jgi:hypothetical protein
MSITGLGDYGPGSRDGAYGPQGPEESNARRSI